MSRCLLFLSLRLLMRQTITHLADLLMSVLFTLKKRKRNAKQKCAENHFVSPGRIRLMPDMPFSPNRNECFKLKGESASISKSIKVTVHCSRAHTYTHSQWFFILYRFSFLMTMRCTEFEIFSVIFLESILLNLNIFLSH